MFLKLNGTEITQEYYRFHSEIRRGQYSVFINLYNGRLSSSRGYFSKPFYLRSELLVNNREPRSLRPQELSLEGLKEAVQKFLLDPEIKLKIFNKVVGSRYVSPRVHQLSYLKSVLTTNDIKVLIKKRKEEEEILLETLDSMKFWSQLELFLISYLLKPFPLGPEKLIFPL